MVFIFCILTPLKFVGKFLSLSNILILCAFVPTGQKNDKRGSAVREIDAISWSVVYSQFRDTGSYRFHISRISQRKPSNSNVDSGLCGSISKF